MIGHTAGYRRLDGIIWAIVAAAAVLELLAVAFGGFLWRYVPTPPRAPPA